ncbi:hypothetical protein HDU86_003783 [Geranomyces michiganensis]|nr:hypothetical protein HDU86_003783 [Geranomyces michiganensis]
MFIRTATTLRNASRAVRFPRVQPRFYSSRLTASELRDVLPSSSSASAHDTITLSVRSKTEMSQSGVGDSYTVGVKDLRAALEKAAKDKSDPTHFEYSAERNRVEFLINSSASSDLAAALKARAKPDETSDNDNGSGQKSLEKEFDGEYGASNKEMSKTTKGKQPANF